MSNWPWRRLKHLAASPIINGLGEAAVHDDSTWPRYIRTTDIGGPRALRPQTFASLPPRVAAAATVRRGDILMSAAGSVGKTYLHGSDEVACFAGYLVRFRPTPLVDPRFVSYWTETPLFQDQIEVGKVRSTIDNFSAGKYRNLAIQVPDLVSQEAVADFLDAETARIDALVKKRQSMINLLRERQSAVDGARILGSTEARVPLGRFVSSLSQGVSPIASDRPAVGDEWGVLKLSAVKDGGFQPQQNKTLDPDFNPVGHVRPESGDVLVTRANTPALVGAACFVAETPPRMLLSDLIYKVTVDRRTIMPEFIASALGTADARAQLSAAARGTSQSMVKLRGEDIRQVMIPVPGLGEQAILLRELNARRAINDATIHAMVLQAARMREHRQALITAAVAGEIDVTRKAS